MTNIVDVPLHLWEKCLAYVQRFIAEASRLLTRCRGVGIAITITIYIAHAEEKNMISSMFFASTSALLNHLNIQILLT